jgi:hypothetical protein
LHFHHLWAANPGRDRADDRGTATSTPASSMIDAKPIPGSDKVVASFSPGHGQREHAGVRSRWWIPEGWAPDAHVPSPARTVPKGDQFYVIRGPFRRTRLSWRLGRARRSSCWTMAPAASRSCFRLPAADVRRRACNLQRAASARGPRPLRGGDPRAQSTRPRSTGQVWSSPTSTKAATWPGFKRGEIRKLLVLETLPMPIHYTGGMDPLSYGGTFTLERIVGTVPVEPKTARRSWNCRRSGASSSSRFGRGRIWR